MFQFEAYKPRELWNIRNLLARSPFEQDAEVLIFHSIVVFYVIYPIPLLQTPILINYKVYLLEIAISLFNISR